MCHPPPQIIFHHLSIASCVDVFWLQDFQTVSLPAPLKLATCHRLSRASEKSNGESLRVYSLSVEDIPYRSVGLYFTGGHTKTLLTSYSLLTRRETGLSVEVRKARLLYFCFAGASLVRLVSQILQSNHVQPGIQPGHLAPLPTQSSEPCNILEPTFGSDMFNIWIGPHSPPAGAPRPSRPR